MLPPPHGGRLVDRQLSAREVERLDLEVSELPRLRPDPEQVLDAVKIGVGAYSPLDGFMDRASLASVLNTGRLPNGLPWPIPIFLAPGGRENAVAMAQIRPGDEAALLDDEGRFFALLHVREAFPLDRAHLAIGTYGTEDAAHPNVGAMARLGNIVLSGRIDLLRTTSSPLSVPELSPVEARELFARKGWRNVAGYQTRHVPHLGHEHLQRLTLERDDVDGLFIHPVIEPAKDGDDRPETVLAAYQSLISNYYPAARVVLAPLLIGMRYAGPRGALFLAIIRKNFGCSHYVVGRDQAGFGGYYDPYACHRIFDEFPIGIVPVRYRELAYCSRCREMVSEKTCGHPAEFRDATNQTRVRQAIAERKPLPSEILRPEIAEMIRRLTPLLPGYISPSIPPSVASLPGPTPASQRRPPGPGPPEGPVEEAR